ncbi:MAG TPA: hypothetical protein VHS31_10545, partial [Tepidisphaeraceae bacterium]|nr:hypothetical protein [Tepidisphaeraceae bacterium]
MHHQTNTSENRGGNPYPRWPSGRLSIALLCLMVFAGLVLTAAIGAMLGRQYSTRAMPTEPTSGEVATSKPASALAGLAAKLDEAMQISRPILLGSRDPSGPSCVSIVHTGEVHDVLPSNPGDWNGGPGTTLATLYYFDRQSNKSPMTDFNWHQNRLKTYLQNESATNKEAAENAHELVQEAMRFSESANGWTSFPGDLTPAGFKQNTDWPSYCMAALDHAVATKDLKGTQHWADELAVATFSLEDLHAWLGFLDANQLTALEFQNRCQSLFASAEALHLKYEPQTTVSQFPAGVLSLNGLSNYYEVERQAERLFSMPPERFDEITVNQHLTPTSLWVSPNVRECFLKLEAVLSPENRATWDLAARSPYHHSYLINMLYRAWAADTANEFCAALKKFDALNPHATVGELLGVLMYRGHSFAGLEWADRFQPQLLGAADEIDENESDATALLDACKWTNSFYKAPATYGVTLTLRDALQEKKLDCVRATDMIGAIFRNAGRSRFAHVRWCAETAGHSVAAYMGTENEKIKPLIVDGLNPPEQPEVWPDCY